jgi:hypothetical protein
VCENGNLEIIEYLIEKGAQLEVLTVSGKAPLHFGRKNI